MASLQKWRFLLALAACLAPWKPVAADTDRGVEIRRAPDAPEDAAETGVPEGVVGHVQDRAGRPIADVLILPRSLEPEALPIPEIAIVSDADGRYAWRLFPGRYEITASAPGYGEVTLPAVVEAGQATVLDFTLEPGP